MDEDVVSLIADAEQKAAAKKAQANARAMVIAATTETETAAISQRSERSCKEYRAKALEEATSRAQAEYALALEKSRREAHDYAEECLERIDGAVADIVGRIVK